MIRKVKKYTGDKIYAFPSGEIATKEVVIKKFPAIQYFTHVIETDEAEQVMFSLMNLSVLRSQLGIDSSLSEDEAIAKIEEIRNTPVEVNVPPSAEERIAAALEYQVLTSLPDESDISASEGVK